MAITEFHKPQKVQHQQSYVDQYVPMPFEIMQKAAQNRQDVADKNNANTDALMKALEVDTRSQDRQAHREYVDNVRSQIDSVIDSYNGDASLASKELRKIIREQQSSLSGGDLKAWGTQKALQDQYLAKIDEYVKLGRGKGGIDAATGQKLKEEEYGLYGQSRLGNQYGQFSGVDPREQLNYNEIFDKFGKDWKANSSEKAFFNENGEMIHYGEKGWEGVADKELRKAFDDYIKSTPALDQEFNQAQRLGMDMSDWKRAREASVSKYGFDKTDITQTYKNKAGAEAARDKAYEGIDVVKDIMFTSKYDYSNPSSVDSSLQDLTRSAMENRLGNDGVNVEQDVNKWSNNYFNKGLDGNGYPIEVGGNDLAKMSKLDRMKLIGSGEYEPEFYNEMSDSEKLSYANSISEAAKKLELIQDQEKEFELKAIEALGDKESINKYNSFKDDTKKLVNSIGYDKYEDYVNMEDKLTDAIGMAAPGRNVPYETRVSIALESNPELKDFYKKREKIKTKIDTLEDENVDLRNKVKSIKDNRMKTMVDEVYNVEEHTLPQIDGVNQETKVNVKKAIQEAASNKFFNSMSGVTTDGSSLPVKELTEPIEEGGKQREVNVYFSNSALEGRSVMIEGFDKDGNQRTIKIPQDEIQIPIPGVDPNILRERDLQSRAVKLMDEMNSRPNDYNSLSHFSNIMPNDIKLRTPNLMDPTSEKNLEGGFDIVKMDSDGGIINKSPLSLNQKQKERLFMDLLSYEDKIRRAETIQQRNALIKEGREVIFEDLGI